jgi:chromosome segregation ATPase
VTDLTDPFQKLEERLTKVLELFKRTQGEKHALEHEVEKLRANSKEHAKTLQTLERELVGLRREREEVRERIEKLLQRIDVLTSSDSGG